MTSYTSSFNKLLIINAIVLVILTEWVVFLIYSNKGIDYKLSQRIEEEKPGLVLLGTSGLTRSMREPKMEKALLELTKKKCKVVIFGRNNRGGSYFWYLILRNQIAEAGYKGPVGFVITDDELTLWADFSPLGNKELIVNQLRKNESLQMSKEINANISHWNFGLWEDVAMIQKAHTVSRDLRSGFVSTFLRYADPSIKPDKVLGRQFNLDSFEAEIVKNVKSDYDFLSALERSYLPEIVQLKKQYDLKLFVVILPTLTKFDNKHETYQQKKLYYEQMGDYLQKNGIPFISFWESPELLKKEMFQDPHHMHENTPIHEMIAEALAAHKIIQ